LDSGSAFDDSRDGDDIESAYCSINITAESPLVPVRRDSRFSFHMPDSSANNSPQSLNCIASSGGSNECSVGDSQQHEQQQQQQQQQQHDDYLFKLRSHIPEGSSSNVYCTNLKHHHSHGYQGTIVWERWQLEEFLQARKRVCHVSNICWSKGRLTMYYNQITQFS
jgi:hypothetical protein